MDNQTFITQGGLKHLEEELKELKTTKRREIADRIQAAKELGDLSENAEYHEAKEMQAFNEGKVAELEHLVKNAQVIKKGASSGGVVTVGSTIDVKTADGKTMTFTIMGSQEADPSKGMISNASPLGKTFLGHKKGETVSVTTPRAIQEFMIVSVK